MKLFIAGPGNVSLFDGTGKLALTSKTLVDSSIGFQVTLEDIRAGLGAKLYGKYAHTTGMTMKLTDAMWNLQFLAANVGANIDPNSGTALTGDSRTSSADANPSIDISDITPVKLFTEEDKIYVWYAKKGSEEWHVHTYKDGAAEAVTSITGANVLANTEYCIKYVNENDSASSIKVNSAFIPSTFTAVLEATLFAGDVNSETGTKAGKISITMPRYMLNGTMDLSMTMTGAAQMTMEGSALAVESADCEDGEGYYATISQILLNANWYDGLQAVYVNDADDYEATVGANAFGPQDLTVMGLFDGNIMKQLASTRYTIVSGNADGVTLPTGFSIANGVVTIAGTVTPGATCPLRAVTTGAGAPTLSDSFTLTVATA